LPYIAGLLEHVIDYYNSVRQTQLACANDHEILYPSSG
jgi:hypothetical protein